MDVLILTLTFIIGVSFTLGTLMLIPEMFTGTREQKTSGRSLAAISLACIALFSWGVLAYVNHNPTPTIIDRPIEELRNVPFYFDENDKPVEIKGDGRFADPKTTQVRITIVPGDWKWLMYVTESRKVEFVKVASAPVEK